MHRGDVTTVQWERRRPLLPPQPPTIGRPAVDPRRLLNGLLGLVRTGAPWRDGPARYGPWRTGASRFSRWRHAGVWQRLFAPLKQQAAAGQLDGPLHFIDRPRIRAHPQAAGAQQGTLQPKRSGAVRGALARQFTCVPKAPGRSCRGS